MDVKRARTSSRLRRRPHDSREGSPPCSESVERPRRVRCRERDRGTESWPTAPVSRIGSGDSLLPPAGQAARPRRGAPSRRLEADIESETERRCRALERIECHAGAGRIEQAVHRLAACPHPPRHLGWRDPLGLHGLLDVVSERLLLYGGAKLLKLPSSSKSSSSSSRGGPFVMCPPSSDAERARGPLPASSESSCESHEPAPWCCERQRPAPLDVDEDAILVLVAPDGVASAGPHSLDSSVLLLGRLH
jgi:hypothetical protein